MRIKQNLGREGNRLHQAPSYLEHQYNITHVIHPSHSLIFPCGIAIGKRTRKWSESAGKVSDQSCGDYEAKM